MTLTFKNIIPSELANNDKYVRDFKKRIIEIAIKQFTKKMYDEYDEFVNTDKQSDGSLEIKFNLNISNTNN